MSGAHAHPSHPGRAVLALAALASIPRALVLTDPWALTAALPTSAPDTVPDAGTGQADHRRELHPDRFGEHPRLEGWSSP